MGKEGRSFLMLIAAGYIIYTGVTTIKGTLTGEQGVNTPFLIIGIIFILFGVAAMHFYGRAFIKGMRESAAEVEKEDEEIEQEMIEESEEVKDEENK